MCDLCCTFIAVRPRFVGEIALCARCHARYEQLIPYRAHLDASDRLFVVSRVHRTHCGACARTMPVVWYDSDGAIYRDAFAEPWVPMFCEQIAH